MNTYSVPPTTGLTIQTGPKAKFNPIQYFTVGKERILPNVERNATHANAVNTCYGVTDVKPTSELDPLDARRSPRLQTRVRISGRNDTPPVTRQLQEQRSPRRNTHTPYSSPSSSRLKIPLRQRKSPQEGEETSLEKEDKYLVRLPMTFPLRDIGTPTPGTTNLDEPPEGQLPPPLLGPL